MKLYFDGSRGGQSNEWLTLAGVVATDAIWDKFRDDWRAMLHNRDPIAPHIHMTDLVTRNDPFREEAGWSREKVDRLVADIINLLAAIPTTHLCAFSCSVDVLAHKRLLTEGYEIADPAVICAEISLGKLLLWFKEHHDLFALAHLFYDQNEKFIKSIRRRWQELNKPKKVTTELLWGSIAEVEEVSMECNPEIQLADVLAWAFTRRLRDAPEDNWAKLANTLVGTREYSGILTATQLPPITEDIMRAKHQKKTP